MRLRKPPRKPVRHKKVLVQREMGSFDNLRQMYDWASAQPVKLEEIRIRLDYFDLFDSSLEYHRPETDDEFQERMEAYEVKLAKHNRWEEEHAALIKLERQKELLKVEREIEKLRKQREQLAG